MVPGFVVAMLGFITMFAVLGAYLPELYEPRVRCTGASTAYNLGGVLGGALTPIIATELSRGSGRRGRTASRPRAGRWDNGAPLQRRSAQPWASA